MTTEFFNPSTPKKSTNLSINGDLLQQARALNINLSRLLEQRLAEVIREKHRRQWLQENKAAIEAYNRRIERDGAFSDELRRF